MEILTVILEQIPEIALAGISLFVVIDRRGREREEKKFDRKMLAIMKKEELEAAKIDQDNKAFDLAENKGRADQDNYYDYSRSAEARVTRIEEEVKLLEK